MNENYGDIGELLKAARMEMRISIADAATRLHIRPRYLEALEAGLLRDLPGMSYTRGYIARYATFLRLDKDEVLRRFDRVEAAVGRRGFYLPLNFSKEKRPSSTLVWVAVAVALAIYAAWWMSARPPHGQAPVVESIEQARARKITLSAEEVQRNTCLAPAQSYYPACFWRDKGFDPAALLVQAQYLEALRLFSLPPEARPPEPAAVLPEKTVQQKPVAPKPAATNAKIPSAALENENEEESGSPSETPQPEPQETRSWPGHD